MTDYDELYQVQLQQGRCGFCGIRRMRSWVSELHPRCFRYLLEHHMPFAVREVDGDVWAYRQGGLGVVVEPIDMKAAGPRFAAGFGVRWKPEDEEENR